MVPSIPRVPTTDDERTQPGSATFDNKVKQHFGQALSDTDGVTNHVKGFLECIEERIALDGRPLASPGKIDGLIGDILNNDRANKKILDVIKRELLRKIKQKTKLNFCVKVMQKKSAELAVKSAAIQQAKKSWPSLSPDVDFSNLIVSMQGIVDGEQRQVKDKEKELDMLRKELDSLKPKEQQEFKLPDSKTVSGVQVHTMDKQDCLEELRKAEKAWLKQFSTIMGRETSRMSNYTRSSQDISDLHGKVKLGKEERDRLVDELKDLVNKNFAIHRELLHQINKRRNIENNAMDLCLDIEDNIGEKLHFDATNTDWGLDTSDEMIRRNDRLASDLGDAFAQALASYETNLRRLVDAKDRIAKGIDWQPGSTGLGRRLAESAARDAELELLGKQMEQCRSDAEKLKQMLQDRERDDVDTMKRRIKRRMDVRMMAQFGNTVIIGSSTIADQVKAIDELTNMKRRLLSELEDIDEKIEAIKCQMKNNPDHMTIDSLHSRFLELQARRKELVEELEACKKKMLDAQADNEPGNIERNIIRMDFDFKQKINGAGQLACEIMKLKLAAAKQNETQGDLSKELSDKKTYNTNLIERAGALKDSIKQKMVELNVERERHIYHAAPRLPGEQPVQRGILAPPTYILRPQVQTTPTDGAKSPPIENASPVTGPPPVNAPAPVEAAPVAVPMVKEEHQKEKEGEEQREKMLKKETLLVKTSVEDSKGKLKESSASTAQQGFSQSQFESDEALFREVCGDEPAEVIVDVPQINIKMIRKKRVRAGSMKKTSHKTSATHN